MNNPIIYQVVGGLLILFFFYLTYMFTHTWRWVHVTAAFLVFAAAIGLSLLAAMSNRTHLAWRQVATQQQNRVEQLTGERELLLHGAKTELVQSRPSIRSLHAELGRVLLDRGRVWRNCTASPPAADGTLTLRTGETPNRITPPMIMHAFAEQPAPPEMGLPDNSRLPRFYLTELVVTAATDDSVTVRPALPLTSVEQSMIAAALSAGASITLYESMPVDGHEFFASAAMEEQNWSLPASEQPVFGNIDPQLLGQAFQPFQPPAENQEATQAFQAMLAPYLRDGRQADKEQDPPENVWLKVRFLQPHSEQVDSAVALDAVSGSQTFYEGGLANVPLLQRGEPASFVPGDVGIFPREQAEQLIREGKAEELEPVFVRRLNHYEYAFRELSQRLVALNDEIGRVQRDTEAATVSNRRTEEQIQYRVQERTDLEADLARFRDELQVLVSYAQTLQQQSEARREELSRLYRENHQLVEELAALEREVARQVDERTLQAVSAQ